MISKTNLVNSQVVDNVKVRKSGETGSTIDIKDKVEISGSNSEQKPEKRPLPSRAARLTRKSIARVAGVFSGVANAVKNIPTGLTQGVEKALHPDHDIATRKKSLAKVATMESVALGSAVGAAVFGPVGLILGAAGGYIGSVISNFLDNKAGIMDSLISRVDSAVDNQIDKLPKKEESGNLRKAVNAGVRGAIEAAKEGWDKGRHIGSGTAAGLLSGAQFIAKDLKENAKEVREEIKHNKELGIKNKDKHGILGKTVRNIMGTVTGLSGVMLNVPGGMVEGSLEAVEVGFHRKEITRPLLLFATNAGKVLPPALAGAALGGPVGAAVGTAVGLITGSLTTLIDGKYGFNHGIIRRIDKAIGEVVEDGADKGYAVYHNASKGALVGAYAGLKEGWSLGYKGGSEIVDGVFETPFEAAKHEETEEQKKTPTKQMQFKFMDNAEPKTDDVSAKS